LLLLPLLMAACASTPEPRLGAGGHHKLGKPYQIGGRWYHPKDERDYAETGVASWYGPGFDGKPTANGERYDQNAVSAAHRTLPLPSHVEVANLDNGRRLVVRVNDRGPFARDRIIDLSRRAAQLLGFEAKGTARVRLRRVYPDREPHPVAAAAPAAPTLLADALPPDEQVTLP
jgi:rare lipoprotein A